MGPQQSRPADQASGKDTQLTKQLIDPFVYVPSEVVPSFRQYNENKRESAVPAASQDTKEFDEALDILDNISAQPTSTPKESCWYDAKFAVDEVIGQGKRSGQTVYKVEWTSSKVPTRLLQYVDGRPEVQCSKQEYTVRSVCPLSPELGSNDEPQLLVAWKPTWEDEQAVKALARPQLEAFLRRMRESQERDTPEDRGMQPEKERGSPAVSASDLPQQAIVYSTNFKPERSLVYNDAMRRLLRGAAGDVGEMLWYPDKNDLVFRNRYVEKNTVFNAECNRMRRAAALQMVGTKQKKKCDYCKKGFGPFRGCVVLTGFGRGACANCLYGARMPMACNYHCRSRAERPRKPDSLGTGADRESLNVLKAATLPPDIPQASTTVAGAPVAMEEKCAPHTVDPQDATPAMQRSPSPVVSEEQEARPVCIKQVTTEGVEDSRSVAEPAYLSPLFRHPRCRKMSSRCTHPVASYSRLARKGGVVVRGRVFRKGEATAQEVRWLISMSVCSMTEFLQQAWLWRLKHCDQEPLPPEWRKETFISQHHWAELNKIAEQTGGGRMKSQEKRGKKPTRAKMRA